MAVISMFYGIIVSTPSFTTYSHPLPMRRSSICHPDGELLEGTMIKSKQKLLQARIEIP